MRRAYVVPLDDFTESSHEGGLNKVDILSVLMKVQKHPWHGHVVAPLYNELGKLPMGGFYARTDRFVIANERREGHTLSLYFSGVLPVYVFRFSLEPLERLPWNVPENLAFLLETGQALHANLMKLET